MPSTTASRLKIISIRKAIRGFTLIELLVVIAIIGILVTIAIASFTAAQTKARDGRRKGDLDAIKKALELAKNDSSAGTFYPGCTGATSCFTATTLIPNIVASSYIRATPVDPSQAVANSYVYAPNPATTVASVATGYTLSACLENANDTGGNTTASAGFGRTCPANARIYFVTHP